ncbi:hypothetical protein V8F06_009402 [Rhypophila decipiens]
MDALNISQSAKDGSTSLANTSATANTTPAQPTSTPSTISTPMAPTIAQVPRNAADPNISGHQTAPTVKAIPESPPRRTSARLAGQGGSNLARNGNVQTAAKGKTAAKSKTAAKGKTGVAAQSNLQPRPQTPAQQLAMEAAKKAASAHTNSLPIAESFARGDAVPSSSNPGAASSLASPSTADGVFELTKQEKRLMDIAKSDNPLGSARAFYLEGVRADMRAAGFNKKAIAVPTIPQETLDMAAGSILYSANQITARLEEKMKVAKEAREKQARDRAAADVAMGSTAHPNAGISENTTGLNTRPAAVTHLTSETPSTQEHKDINAPASESESPEAIASQPTYERIEAHESYQQLPEHRLPETENSAVAGLTSAEIDELVQRILKSVRVIAGSDATTPDTLGADVKGKNIATEEPESQAGVLIADVAMGGTDVEAAPATCGRLKRKAETIEEGCSSSQEPPQKKKAIIALPFRDLVPPMTDLKLKFKGKVFMTIGMDANWTRGYHIPGPLGHGFST